jgi:hypothetical protein
MSAIFVAIFVVIAFAAGLVSAVTWQIVYNSVVDTLPPQFQDPETSRYAISVYALASSTPLPIQGDYMVCGMSGWVMLLSASLALFSAHQSVFGCLLLGAIAVAIPAGIKSWKTYRDNCERAGKDPFHPQ